MFKLNAQFKMTGVGPEFQDSNLNIFWDWICDYGGPDWMCDATEEEIKDFFKDIKRWFVYDNGSNESDYPEIYGFFDSISDLNDHLKSYDVYNYKHVKVFDLYFGKRYNIKLNYDIIGE